MARRFGTRTLVFIMSQLYKYWARNRAGIQADPSITPTLFNSIETCLTSVADCVSAIEAVLPLGD